MNDSFDFDDQLRSAFGQAAESVPNDGFAERVTQRLGRPDGRRYLILGGVGSTGAAFSGTQLEGLFEGVMQSPAMSTGWLAQAQGFFGPETLAASVMALGVAALAFIIPKTNLT